MDESLDALANILNDISENPYDVSLHAKHIHLVRSFDGMEAEVLSALEMLTNFLAAGEDEWLALIKLKEESLDLDTTDGVIELLALYARAEEDYHSIPIMQKHLEFIVDRHAHYLQEPKPPELGDVFSTEWTRTAITEVVNKGVSHLTQGHLLWDVQRDWELQMLQNASPIERQPLLDSLQHFHLRRLRQPHSTPDDTLQSYSSLVTNFKDPQEYEPLLVTASKICSQGARAYDRRDFHETQLAKSKFALDTYVRYIGSERRAKNPDLYIVTSLYERAIAEAAKRRFNGEEGAEGTLQMFWIGYCDFLRTQKELEVLELQAFRRAVRSVPASGEIWARYIRFAERMSGQLEAPENIPLVEEIFNQAFQTKLLQKDVEQIVPVILARAGFEKRRLEAGEADEDGVATLIAVLEGGIEMVRHASQTGDPRLRLEKYLAYIYFDMADLVDNALAVWESAAKVYKSSYLVWQAYTEALIKAQQFDKARKVFLDVYTKNVDWPEAIWEAWLLFEHMHGTADSVNTCIDKIEKAQYQVNMRRAKDAEKMVYQAQAQAQAQALQVVEDQAANVEMAEAPVINEDKGAAMEIDVPQNRGTKRTAEETVEPAVSEAKKKPKLEPKPPPLKRDRENCTVFVADLPANATEEDLQKLFKDCGKVREVKITDLGDARVATVEFIDRDSIPAALTKDKKRLDGQEVAVHLAWKSTLYVANFPESMDDAAVRELFGSYGTIFDVRWPSKKIKTTRRFCYVQYTSPAAAEKALELHKRELEPNMPLNVYISNPERKKERTDQNANEREVYVAGLSKFTTKADLLRIFKTYGAVKDLRMGTDESGNCKGFAFVEYENENDAQAALAANNHELRNRRIAVTLADSRVRARRRPGTTTESGLTPAADARNRSVRVRNLPPGAQEGLLQQALEKVARLKRVEVIVDVSEAVVELESAAEAGKLLLRTEPIMFNGTALEITQEGRIGGSLATAPPPKAGGLFVPRSMVSRPRAGLAKSRVPAAGPSTAQTGPTGGKGQDDFRKMLG